MSETSESNENGQTLATQILPLKPSADCFIYREDVVSSSKYKGLLGVVLEVAGDSDSDSDDSTTDDSDNEVDKDKNVKNEVRDGNRGDDDPNNDSNGDNDDDYLPEGHARIAWIDGSETTDKINDITLVDRTFLHGDMVSSITDPTGQLGLVVDVNIKVDLLASNGEIIINVPSKDLVRIRKFSAGDYVISGIWLGRVDDVLDNVTVLFDDGSICKVLKADQLKLQPVKKPITDDGSCPYYPGQRIRAVSSSVFKSSRWLSGLWKPSCIEGTVCRVETASVVVYWIASANIGFGSSSFAPPEQQNPKDLILLDCFSHADWQLCDFCLLPSSHNAAKISDKTVGVNHKAMDKSKKDNSCKNVEKKAHTKNGIPEKLNQLDPAGFESINQGKNNVPESSGEFPRSVPSSSLSKAVSKEATAHESWSYCSRKLRKVSLKKDKKYSRKNVTFESAFFISRTITKVDVVWQDGTKECGLDSTFLIPIQTPNDHEFFPNQYVIEKPSENNCDSSEMKRTGIVKSLNAREKTVTVRWSKPVSCPQGTQEFANEEVVSVYELDEHPDYDYRYGDVVVRLSPESITNESKDLLKDEFFCSLPWVGNITGLQDGDIEVTWVDGSVSKVGPQGIYVVARNDEDSLIGGSELSDGGASWETVDENDNAIVDGEKEGDFSDQTKNDADRGRMSSSSENISQGVNSPLSISFAALSFVARFATGIFSPARKQSSFNNKDANESGSCNHEEISTENLDFLNQNAMTDTQNQVDDQEDVKLFGTNTKDSVSAEVDGSCSFKHFDIAENPLDHHYSENNFQSTCGKKWVKKVQQEWNILEKNLPDDIFVRAYEDRMDLLRAVIIGAAGTPYQDGLFFFDFRIPPEYPQVPLSAHYHSGGLRVNPNLYVDGKVCLSLLNTWTGKGNEVWDPSSSSILQVLVSLQGLVLNAYPYFNEAGYDKQVGTIEGEKNSLPYNENTYLLNLKSMMYLLRRPPMLFEDFVKEHFRRRGHYILKACEAYMGDCTIGSLTKDASPTEKSKEHPCSLGFKIMLSKILPRLISAFKEIGLDCQEFEHLEKPENLPRS